MSQSAIKSFLSHPYYAVVGASSDPAKYGSKVLTWYQQHQRSVTPINPTQHAIQGIPCLPSLSLLPSPKTTAVSIITPPAVTEKIIEEAIRIGIPAVWMQPGSSSPKAVEMATHSGLLVLADGPCILRDSHLANL